jgi:hypothetical protein
VKCEDKKRTFIGGVAMIKGKRKNLEPGKNLESILEANVGLPAWRQVVRRPRRRVAIAYYIDEPKLWAEFEWRRRLYRDARGQVKLGSVITYRRQSEKPRGGFIADGKAHSIERPGGEIVKVSYAFAQDKTISVPDDIVVAFREVWHINIDKDLTSQAYKKWKADNLPQNK